MLLHGIGVPTSLSVVDIGTWGLGHQSPETLVVGLVGQMPQLFVDDLELLTQTTKSNPGLP